MKISVDEKRFFKALQEAFDEGNKRNGNLTEWVTSECEILFYEYLFGRKRAF